MRISLQLGLVALVFVAAGCASSKKAVHPLVGDWNYRVTTDERIYTGLLSFQMTDDVLQGTMTTEGTEGKGNLANVKWEAPKLKFDATSSQHGALNVTLTFNGDSFAGEMVVPRYGLSVPMRGTRVADGTR